MSALRYQHVIWDWNGTLLDDAWLSVAVMNGLLAARGLPVLTAQTYRELFDFPVVDYYRRLGFDFSRDPFDRVGTEFIVGYEARRGECRLRPDAEAVLGRLREAGLSQSVLSAQKQGTLDGVVAEYGLADFFLHCQGIDDHFAAGKLEQGHRLMQVLQPIEPAQVLLIGDTTHDREVACALGIDCRLVASGHQTRERLEGCGVPVGATLSEICADLAG